jgi:hypothetical protein
MRIYRVENKLDQGMYTGAYSLCDIMDTRSTPRHPTPNNDSGLSDDYWEFMDKTAQYRFGFSTLAQLRSWLYDDEWLRALHGWDYRLSLYDAKKAIVGNTQALFDLAGAVRTSQRSLLTLIPDRG